MLGRRQREKRQRYCGEVGASHQETRGWAYVCLSPRTCEDALSICVVGEAGSELSLTSQTTVASCAHAQLASILFPSGIKEHLCFLFSFFEEQSFCFLHAVAKPRKASLSPTLESEAGKAIPKKWLASVHPERRVQKKIPVSS